jgi:hypothetical protein
MGLKTVAVYSKAGRDAVRRSLAESVCGGRPLLRYAVSAYLS